jgi:hypothetical protein
MERNPIMSEQRPDKQKLLRRALQGNALFSVMAGVAILAGNRSLVAFLGLPSAASLAPVGIGLLGYAAWLGWNARRQKIKIVDAWIAVILDMVWVTGSYLLLFKVSFTNPGKWVVVLVAELVFAFGVTQWLGLRRIARSPERA